MDSRLRDLEPPSAFVLECRRLLDARLAAKTRAEKDDAEWALEFAMKMHREGRFEAYLASRQDVA